MNEKTRKEFIVLLAVMVLLLLADQAFLYLLFHEPHRQDGLTNLFILLIIIGINLIIGTFLLFFKKIGAGIAFYLNVIPFTIGFYYSASNCGMTALRNEFSSYKIKTADTTFVLYINKNEEKSFNILYTFPGVEASYIYGFYKITSDSTYILDVDTTTYMHNKHLRQFTISADTIKGFREEPIVMERII